MSPDAFSRGCCRGNRTTCSGLVRRFQLGEKGWASSCSTSLPVCFVDFLCNILSLNIGFICLNIEMYIKWIPIAAVAGVKLPVRRFRGIKKTVNHCFGVWMSFFNIFFTLKNFNNLQDYLSLSLLFKAKASQQLRCGAVISPDWTEHHL